MNMEIGDLYVLKSDRRIFAIPLSFSYSEEFIKYYICSRKYNINGISRTPIKVSYFLDIFELLC